MTDTTNFDTEYKSLTISEFEKFKIGVCWDFVHYEARWFKTNGYKFESFFIQVDNDIHDYPTHTYLVFYLPNSPKVYYFEVSWYMFRGIEIFNSIEELHETIKNRHIEFNNARRYERTFFRESYEAESKKFENLSCKDFMILASNGKNASLFKNNEYMRHDN